MIGQTLLLLDLRRKPPPVPPAVYFMARMLKLLNNISVITDSKLTSEPNTDALCAKARQRARNRQTVQ